MKSRTSQVVTDRDILKAAALFLNVHGMNALAELQTSRRELLARGDADGATICSRIAEKIDEIARSPDPGEVLN